MGRCGGSGGVDGGVEGSGGEGGGEGGGGDGADKQGQARCHAGSDAEQLKMYVLNPDSLNSLSHAPVATLAAGNLATSPSPPKEEHVSPAGAAEFCDAAVMTAIQPTTFVWSLNGPAA